MIVHDFREHDLTNFQNMLPSCAWEGNGSCLQPHPERGWAAVLEGTQQYPRLAFLYRHGNLRWIFEVGSSLYAFFNPFTSVGVKLWWFFPVRACWWRDALPPFSVNSGLWCVCLSITNSASSLESIMFFLNSCGRQASYVRQQSRIFISAGWHYCFLNPWEKRSRRRGYLTDFSLLYKAWWDSCSHFSPCFGIQTTTRLPFCRRL